MRFLGQAPGGQVSYQEVDTTVRTSLAASGKRAPTAAELRQDARTEVDRRLEAEGASPEQRQLVRDVSEGEWDRAFGTAFATGAGVAVFGGCVVGAAWLAPQVAIALGPVGLKAVCGTIAALASAAAYWIGTHIDDFGRWAWDGIQSAAAWLGGLFDPEVQRRTIWLPPIQDPDRLRFVGVLFPGGPSAIAARAEARQLVSADVVSWARSPDGPTWNRLLALGAAVDPVYAAAVALSFSDVPASRDWALAERARWRDPAPLGPRPWAVVAGARPAGASGLLEKLTAVAVGVKLGGALLSLARR